MEQVGSIHSPYLEPYASECNLALSDSPNTVKPFPDFFSMHKRKSVAGDLPNTITPADVLAEAATRDDRHGTKFREKYVV